MIFYAMYAYVAYRAIRWTWWAWKIDQPDYLPMATVQREIVKQARREGRLG